MRRRESILPAFSFSAAAHHQVAHSLVLELAKRNIRVSGIKEGGWGDGSLFLDIPLEASGAKAVRGFHENIRESLVAAWGNAVASSVEGRVVYATDPNRILDRDAPVHRVTQQSIEGQLTPEDLKRLTVVGVELRSISAGRKPVFTYRTPEEWEHLKPFHFR